jgi:hypothetical protein
LTLVLPRDISRLHNIATNGDSVKLPSARVGMMRAVHNDDTSEYCEIFPNTSDEINNLGVNNGIVLSPNSSVIFYCLTPAIWNTYARDLPFVGGFVAAAAGVQGDGQLTDGFTRISVVVSNGDAVTLPPAYLGNRCELFNGDSTQYIKVFPSSGDSIDSLAVDSPMYLFAGQTVQFNASGATEWWTVPSSVSGFASFPAVGTIQATAPELIADWNQISASTATDNAVQLPEAIMGHSVWIHNDDNADALTIFPKNGASDQIDDNAVDASISLAVNATIELRAISATKWRSNIT